MPGHTTKQDESGWYYHSPFVNTMSENNTTKPLMSQIPGINGCQEQRAAGSTRPYYRDSDSNYVRLAKQGGTKNLLNYQEFDQPKEAVSYARNDWFYLEDNAAEDARNKRDANWKFGVPEYMANAKCGLESGDQRDELQKMESLRMTDNEPTNPDSITSPHKGQSFPNSPTDYNAPTVPTQEIDQVSSDRRGNPPEIKSDRSEMSQIISPNYNIERVKAVVPEQEYKNPILQNDFYHSEPTGHTRKQQGGEREGSDNCSSLPAGYTKKQWSDREGAEVSMSKLLSHTYGKEWHTHNTHTESFRRSPFHTSQETNYQSESNRSQSSIRNKSGDDESNEKIRFIDNGRSVDGFEKSKKDASSENVNYGVTQNSIDPKGGYAHE